ncbi:MAG TPA: YkgJ family cysteine cluster protein [Paraburkholderia sp.]|nr:YkgJ family cysteine cluster protein [Paraburkholderia sp.]
MDQRLNGARVDGHACRPDCGACCIAPSISSPIPGMPDGKPAGVRCVQLGDDLRCAIFGQPERPACCSGLQPQVEMCGTNRREALAWLTQLEAQTQPASQPCHGTR